MVDDDADKLDVDKLFGGDKGKEAIMRAWRCRKTFLADGSLVETHEGTSDGGLPLAAWELIPELSTDDLMTFARAPSWKGVRPNWRARKAGEGAGQGVDVGYECYCFGQCCQCCPRVCYCCLWQDGIVAVMRPAEGQRAQIIEYSLPAVKTCGFGPGPDPDWSNVSVRRTSHLASSTYTYEEASSRRISNKGPHSDGTTRVAHHPNRYRVVWEFVEVDGKRSKSKAQVGCHRRDSPSLKAFHKRTVKLMQQGAPVNTAMQR